MESWRAGMPNGMCLRSRASASSLCDPVRALTLEAFYAEQGSGLEAPVPLDRFAEYAWWFARRSGLEVDERLVRRLSLGRGRFVAVLEDDEVLQAHRVVLAAGITRRSGGFRRSFAIYRLAWPPTPAITQTSVSSAARIWLCSARARRRLSVPLLHASGAHKSICSSERHSSGG